MQISTIQGAYSRFEYGIKAEETRRKYVRRLELFFNFYKIDGKTIQEKSENFLAITKQEKENIQKVNSRKFYVNHRQKILQKKKEYNETNKERIKEYRKKYWQTHKEQIKRQQREYRRSKKVGLAKVN